jgi:outer membrane protein assembly factor BamD
MRELIDGDYLKASQLFQAVAASPRHVKHASLAKLRLGDAFFFQGRYAEAAEIYRGFVQQNNSDPNLPYARFKVAECQYKRIPGEWFASPPAHEFDQTLTQQAEAELKGFITLFPTSVFAAPAQKMLTTVRSMLLRHELYAADFYASHEQWQAVAWRLGQAIDVYPELAVKEDLVWRWAEAWREVGNKRETVRALGLYVDRFPNGDRHELAQKRIEELKRAIEAESVPKAPAADPKVDKPKPDPEDDGTGDDAPDDKPRLKPPELPPLAPGIDD